MDVTSLLMGIAIGVVGAFGTGFLKKAGEDTYSIVKKRLFPKSKEASSHVTINLRGGELDVPSNRMPIEVEHLSGLSFHDIEAAIEKMPPLQQKNVADSYQGIKVEWATYLRNAWRRENGEVSLRLSVDEQYRGRSVVCSVPGDEYRELNILPQGTKIRVSGEIVSASSYEVELSNVRLQILPS